MQDEISNMYDGFNQTRNITEQEIAEQYPVLVTRDMRANAEEAGIVLINRFVRDDPLLTLSDPCLERRGKKVFFHLFFDEEAARARSVITRFTANGHGQNAKEILLIRQEPNKLYEYGYGRICTEMMSNLPVLFDAALAGGKRKEVFAVPLRMFYYPCPVCGARELFWRGDYDICGQCGWEDDGTDDEDSETVPNGDETIRTYRRKYLKHIQKDPHYRWQSPEDDLEDATDV